MRHELHGVWNRANGFIGIGETEATVEGSKNDVLVVRVKSPVAIVLGKTLPRVARVTVEFDEDLWN